jgi:hypothetical protein
MASYVNLASLERGTFGTTNHDEERHKNDIPLSDNWNVENYSSTPEHAFFIVNFLGVVAVDTLVVRMYEKDNRIFTFQQFESFDGFKWTEILKPGETRKGAFKITFDSRLVSQIRIRGRSNASNLLHIVRFQAFNISGTVPPAIAPASASLPQSTGLYNGLMSSDNNRDVSWKVISLPGGATSAKGFNIGENAFIQKANNGWKPAASSTSGWIGITPNGDDSVPEGDYQYQTTFSMPSDCKNLDVGFSVDDTVRSVVVSDGTTKAVVQTITSFNGNGYGGKLSTFTLTNLPATTTLTFTANNGGGLFGLLVQFGACR